MTDGELLLPLVEVALLTLGIYRCAS